MSADRDSDTKQRTIYIPLLNEGTPVLRPTLGEEVGDGLYRVLSTHDYDPDDEEWQFPPGTIVECEKQTKGDEELYVAKKIGNVA